MKRVTKRVSVLLFLVVGLIALVSWMPRVDAFESFYDANCTACHSSTVKTCNGCHGMGVHSGSAKDDINVTGMTDKTSYAPGETVTVTITGGYRMGWIRGILYDENMTELARMSCPGGMGGCTESVYPVTLTGPAPTTPGTYTWTVSWYGNQFDLSEVGGTTFFGPGWTPDPNNPNHGEERVSTNSFTVEQIAPNITLDPPSLDFGTVMIGTPATLPTEIKNDGTADLEVTNIALCAGTSTEFTWAPITLPFTVGPGGMQTLSVTYMPTDPGMDTGCIEITSNDPDTPIAQLPVTGIGQEAETACFDDIDNDNDTLIDCADPDCAGAMNGACDTGVPGVCAAGTLQCQNLAEACVQDTQPSPETPAAGTCADNLDNDCDGLTDAADPDCAPETACFDGIDNDLDGLTDCADPTNCEGVVGPATDCGVGACASTGNRVCQGGVEVDTCTPGTPGTEACTGGIDEDCDGLVDCLDTENCATDPACIGVETECFDGIDNDSDTLIDCADPDCNGAMNGACDTGIPGVCATGQTQCVSGAAQCVQTVFPSDETIAAGTCADSLDNDCDGLTDAADPDCVAVGGDVGLFKLIEPKKIVIAKKSATGQRVINVLAQATEITEPVMAMVTLTAEPGAGVMVTIDPASITKEIMPDETESFGFKANIVCTQEGTWAVNWTAMISAAQNSNPANDTLMGTSQVICK